MRGRGGKKVMAKAMRDLPLGAGPSAPLLPLIVGIMMYLAALAITSVGAIHSFCMSLTHGTDDHVMIIVPPDVPSGNSNFQTHLRQTVSGIKGSSSLRQLTTEDMKSTLGETGTDLSAYLPHVYVLKVTSRQTFSLSQASQRLKSLSPAILVEDQYAWVSGLKRTAHSFELASLTIATLLLLGAIATIAFTSQTDLIIHRQIIEILYLVGATRSYIAGQFQYHALKTGLKGMVVAAFLLGCTFSALGFFLPLGLIFPSPLWGAACLVGGPLVITLFMMLAAQLTVRLALRARS